MPPNKKPKLRPWKTSELEVLIDFFFKKRDILVEELHTLKMAKELNDIVSKLTADDFQPSADQVKRKFRDILNRNTRETEAEAKLSPKIKGMIEQIRKEKEKATSSADEDGIGSPSLASGGSAPSPVPNIKPVLTPTTDESNSSAPGVLNQAGNQDSSASGVMNQAEIQEQLDYLTERYKTLNDRVQRLEDD